MRDKVGYFSTPLSVRRKTCANVRGHVYRRNSGDVSGKYTSGLCSVRKEQQPSLGSFKDYLASLTKDQMSLVVEHLCLLPSKELSTRGMKEKELLALLLEFNEDTTAFRQRQQDEHERQRTKSSVANSTSA